MISAYSIESPRMSCDATASRPSGRSIMRSGSKPMMPVSWVPLQVSPPSSLHQARMPGGCSSWKWLKSSWSTMTTTRPSFSRLMRGVMRRPSPFAISWRATSRCLNQVLAVVVAGEQHHDLVFERPMGVGVAVDEEQPSGGQPDDVRVLGEPAWAAPDVEDPVRDRPACGHTWWLLSWGVWETLPHSGPPTGGRPALNLVRSGNGGSTWSYCRADNGRSSPLRPQGPPSSTSRPRPCIQSLGDARRPNKDRRSPEPGPTGLCHPVTRATARPTGANSRKGRSKGSRRSGTVRRVRHGDRLDTLAGTRLSRSSRSSAVRCQLGIVEDPDQL